MRAGEIVFTGMDRVVFGRPAAEAVAEAAERLGRQAGVHPRHAPVVSSTTS
jgi:hypothetical protein